MVSLTHYAEGSAGHYAENSVRIFPSVRRRADMEGPDSGIVGGIKTKMPGHLVQIIILGGADAAVGEGNMEETAEKILEHCPVASEQPAHLTRIALEPRRALAGEVEYEPDMVLFARRYLENLAKCRHFVAGYRAVGLGHLGAEGDYRDRE